MKTLILCAGLGTRLKPLTNDIPKPMIKVAGKPVLEHLVDHLNEFGITEIIVNLHYKPEKIYKYFGTRLLYFYEPKLLGCMRTIDALRQWMTKDYIVMNGDTLTDVDICQMYQFHKFTKARETAFIDDGICAGTWIYSRFLPGRIAYYEAGSYWQDIGTPEGLKKAREHYERKT